jgi:hypothetical protein
MPEPITNPQGQTPNGTDPQGQTPNNTTPSGQTPNGQRTSIDTLPVDIQDYIKSLRADAKKYRDASEAEAKAKADAEAARLKEQGQFKELADKHEAKVRELEPVATSYTKLAEQINAQIEAEIKDWPAEVKNLVPGADMPAEQRLEQMTKLRPLLEKLQTQAKTQLPGNRPNPQVAQPAATKQAQLEANRAALVRQRGYNI